MQLASSFMQLAALAVVTSFYIITVSLKEKYNWYIRMVIIVFKRFNGGALLSNKHT